MESKELGSADLKIPAQISANTLFFREGLATATMGLKDGRKLGIDLSTTIGSGAIVVGIKAEGDEGWANYLISPDALMKAVIDDYEKRFPKTESQTKSQKSVT